MAIKNPNIGKQYCTRTTANNACYFARDYSTRLNEKCLDCKFCYKLGHKYNPRRYQSQWIHNEYKYNKNLYKTPILISRYCEPFYNEVWANHSINVAKSFIENKSHVIFRTYGTPYIENPEFVSFVKKNKNRIQMQFKLFNHSRNSSRLIKELFCPNVPDIKDVYKRIEYFDFVDRVIVIDPLIIGVNDNDINYIINDMIYLGIKKLIIKQLFATSFFKWYLINSLGMNKKDILTIESGIFNTYDNLTLLNSLVKIIEKCYKNNIDLSFCDNRELNTILNITNKYNNCCMLVGNKYVYDIDVNFMKQKLSGSSSLIKRVNNE